MLDKDLLISEIRKLNDSSYEEFVGFPSSCSLATDKWSDCFLLYCQDMIPSSTTKIEAKNLCRDVLLDICNADDFFESVQIFTNSIIQFCIKLSEGIYDGTFQVFQGIPPIGILNLIPVFLKAKSGGSAYEFAVELAENIDTYFKTGTAINLLTGVTINWE